MPDEEIEEKIMETIEKPVGIVQRVSVRIIPK